MLPGLGQVCYCLVYAVNMDVLRGGFHMPRHRHVNGVVSIHGDFARSHRQQDSHPLVRVERRHQPFFQLFHTEFTVARLVHDECGVDISPSPIQGYMSSNASGKRPMGPRPCRKLWCAIATRHSVIDSASAVLPIVPPKTASCSPGGGVVPVLSVASPETTLQPQALHYRRLEVRR